MANMDTYRVAQIEMEKTFPSNECPRISEPREKWAIIGLIGLQGCEKLKLSLFTKN